MDKSRIVMWLLLLVGALTVGEGIHQMLTPAFWSAQPGASRINAAIYIAAGVCCLVAGWLWNDKAKKD
jgi:hypothetical protein